MTNLFQSKRALRVFGICALSVAFICVILRLLGILFFFDLDIGYFKSGSIVPFILGALLILSTAASFAFCFIPKIKLHPTIPSGAANTQRFAIFPAAAFAYYSIIYGVNLLDYIKLYGSAQFSYYFTLICSVLGCVFFLIAFLGKNTATPLYILCGALAIIWTVLVLAECYFDTFLQMNSPNKIIFQFSALSAMLFTVNEMRIGLDERKPTFHLFSAAMAVIFLSTSALPSTICYYAGKMPQTYALLYSDFVFLMLCVFAVARLLQLCFGKDEPLLTEDMTVCEASCEESSEQEQAAGENEQTVQDDTSLTADTQAEESEL